MQNHLRLQFPQLYFANHDKSCEKNNLLSRCYSICTSIIFLVNTQLMKVHSIFAYTAVADNLSAHLGLKTQSDLYDYIQLSPKLTDSLRRVISLAILQGLISDSFALSSNGEIFGFINAYKSWVCLLLDQYSSRYLLAMPFLC